MISAVPALDVSELRAESVTVAYPGNNALDDVSIALTTGTIHVLVGENGAGKSTLIRVLSGERQPNHGRLFLDDKMLELRSPADAARHAISLVPQELQLFPTLPVWENVTASLHVSWRSDRRVRRRRAAASVERLGDFDVALDALAGDLTPAEQQRVVIARALAEDARFLILDEPTANLSRTERDELLDLLRRLAADGTAILFVSHHLDEVLSIGDRATVLRDGRRIWTRDRSDFDESALVSAMFGSAIDRKGEARGPRARRTAAISGDGPPTLSVEGLHWHRGQEAIDLLVRPGEILGIAGLPGSGAETLNSALVGARSRTGTVAIRGKRLRARVGDAIAMGAGFIPGDRKASGLFMRFSIADNICAPQLARLSRFGVLQGRAIRRIAEHAIAALRIAPPDPGLAIGSLSGGNQQKAIVARWLERDTQLLLADEPTRGTDVATRLEIHELLRAAARDGISSVVFSSDLQELTELSDRILVLLRGGGHRYLDGDIAHESLYEAISGRTVGEQRRGL
jgi:ABC-type sugar transport system ATPase subunit